MQTATATTNDFAGQIDRWVIAGLQTGARTYEQLLAELPGVYPTDVNDSLRRLTNSRKMSDAARAILIESESVSARFIELESSSTLPTPHPLDYDWRFTQGAVRELLSDCNSETDLVCLGTPSVFIGAVERFGPERVVLLDRNAEAIRSLGVSSRVRRMFHFDVFTDPVPGIQCDLVVIDPPWYSEHIRAFLWVASKLCRMGGRLLISLPPQGTRPNVSAELERIFDYARRLGLAITRSQEACLAYETPPFELNALRAAGCNLFSVPWRRGTLVALQRLRSAELERPRFVCPTTDWLEGSLDGTRFRFRRVNRRRIELNDPSLIPLVEGDVLPSVSRRHNLRQSVDVWSSGNRVFRCYGPRVLHQIVQLLDAKTSIQAIPRLLNMPLTKLGIAEIKRAAEQIQEVAKIERFERQFVGRG